MTDNISKMLKQHCVYWGSPVADGYGGFTYADAVQLSCRWEDMEQVILDSKGETITSRALVFLSQDVEVDGMLFKGTLEDLYDSDASDSSAGAVSDPRTIDGAYFIKRFQKTPSVDGVGLLRKAYLTPSLSFGGF